MEPYTVLKHVVLTHQHVPTGRTRHHAGGALLPPASILKIAAYGSENGVYLLHFDAAGNEMTDTFHESELEAFGQAEWEYGVRPSEWKPGDTEMDPRS